MLESGKVTEMSNITEEESAGWGEEKRLSVEGRAWDISRK
jgi:hypothetical protein